MIRGGVDGVGILYQSPKLGVMINGGRKKKLKTKSKFRPRLHEIKKLGLLWIFFMEISTNNLKSMEEDWKNRIACCHHVPMSSISSIVRVFYH